MSSSSGERFEAPWSSGVRASTAIASALIVGGAVVWAVAQRERPALAAAFAAAMLLVLVLAWALAPKAFVLERDALVVARPLRPLRLARAGIRSARLLDDAEARRLGLLGGALRLAGSGGLFGFHGRHWSRALGRFRLYATRASGFVLLETETGPVVITPAEPGRLCEALRRGGGGRAVAR